MFILLVKNYEDFLSIFVGAFSIIAKFAYFSYNEVNKRINPAKTRTARPKDLPKDFVEETTVPSVETAKKKGFRKDNWETLRSKMLDVQRLREEDKKKQNL